MRNKILGKVTKMKSKRKVHREGEFSIANIVLGSSSEGWTEVDSQRMIGKNTIERTGRFEPEDIPGVEAIEFSSVTTYGKVHFEKP